MEIKLYKEQQQAVNKAKDNDYFALFMGAGTGKTYTALEILNQWNSTSVLLVCPKSVTLEWQNSIKTYGNTQNFTIITPQKYSRNVKSYTDDYDTIVLDEAHGMKDPKSKIHKGIKRIKCRKRLILTGTPTDGKEHELLSISNLLSDDIIGNYWGRLNSDFVLGEYDEIMYARAGTYEKYIELFRPYMYAIKQLSTVELPKITVNEITLNMLPKQKEIYDSMKDYSYINSLGREKTVHGDAVLVGKLRSVCSGFYKDEIGGVRSFTGCKEKYLLKNLSSGTIVFINFKHEEQLMIDLCNQLKLSYKVLSGSTNNTPEYIEEIKQFNYDILIVNYKSGGVGLNLVASHHIIMFSLPLSYIDFDQACKRIYRIGQTENCTIDILMCTKSKEISILNAIKRKTKISEKLFS